MRSPGLAGSQRVFFCPLADRRRKDKKDQWSRRLVCRLVTVQIQEQSSLTLRRSINCPYENCHHHSSRSCQWKQREQRDKLVVGGASATNKLYPKVQLFPRPVRPPYLAWCWRRLRQWIPKLMHLRSKSNRGSMHLWRELSGNVSVNSNTDKWNTFLGGGV